MKTSHDFLNVWLTGAQRSDVAISFRSERGSEEDLTKGRLAH